MDGRREMFVTVCFPQKAEPEDRTWVQVIYLGSDSWKQEKEGWCFCFLFFFFKKGGVCLKWQAVALKLSLRSQGTVHHCCN